MSKVKVDTIEDTAGTQNIPVDTVINGSAKAWGNLDGTGVISLRDGFNISSVVDTGTGRYTFNFTNNMVNANISFSGCSDTSLGWGFVVFNNGYSDSLINMASVNNQIAGGGGDDSNTLTLAVYGDLA